MRFYKLFSIAALMAIPSSSVMAADTLTVKQFTKQEAYEVQKPYLIDSLNNQHQKFQDDKTLYGNVTAAEFTFATTSYINAEVLVKGTKQYKVYIAGEEVNGKKGLQPGQYDVKVKYVKEGEDVSVKLVSDKDKSIALVEGTGKRPFNLQDNMLMARYSDASLSASGKYLMYSYSKFNTQGKTEYTTKLVYAQTGKEIRTVSEHAVWMPKTDRYLLTRNVEGKTQLLSIDPLTLDEKVLCKDLPYDNFSMSPTEDYLILAKHEEGPKKETGVYQILTMDDRQPGWRDRRQLFRYDLATEELRPLTYGYKNVWPADISSDGKILYLSVSELRLTQRPTTLVSLVAMDMQTMKVDTLVSKEGFVEQVKLVPGTRDFLCIGGPEAFGGVGKNLPDGLIPSIYDHQLFLFKSDNKEVVPLTKNFDPSINSVVCNGKDGFAYFTAENADSVSLYKVNLKNYKITRIKQPLEDLNGVDISYMGNELVFWGSSACVPYQLYSMNTKQQKAVLLNDLNKDMFSDIQLGTCEGWRFKSKKGYELTGHVYLPAGFDKTKKYPMLVHYYGGCSPTSRRFGNGNHYPAHYWNALGYIVLIVNPSGAAGFGQEWASRHVNTAGEGPAQDIIEAAKWYCDQNSYADSTRLGCLSASYGGFMTQWILTKTDMFACGVSHAGISDHTSYWGNGYWGYNYSEVSMANSYPWTRKDLFVDCSPLYNADKIHKPLLFTHGTADTNVPTMESIQMFCALKLLGRPTALVLVEGENHGIMDYFKRQKWINSICAWFQRYLNHDDSWWNAIYSPKDL